MAFSYSNYKESDAVKKKRQEAEAHSTYNESDAVRLARETMQAHEANRVADWTGGTYGQSVKDALDRINNREKFTYDLNGDALYQQYKDQYMTQGKLAMQDTIGQASALTGGYGNSYAATAGNQAYQGYLQKLNDVVPELYQMALNQYNQEGQDLKDNLAMYQSLYGTEYGEYRDKVSDWNTEQARLSDAYNNERTFDYNKFSSDRDYYNTAYNNERTYDYGQYSDAYDRAFSKYKQDQADYWNQKDYESQSEANRIAAAKADQSAMIASLQQQLKDKDAQYEGWIDPNVQKAGNSENVKLFKASIMTPREFSRTGRKTTIGGKQRVFDNYNQYVDAVAEQWLKKGKITENEAAYIAATNK